MSELAEMKCTACRGDEPTLTDAEIAELRPQVPDWQVVEREGTKRLERMFEFGNFAQALAFTNKVGEQAEEEGHHPALLTECWPVIDFCNPPKISSSASRRICRSPPAASVRLPSRS